jgi:tRNA threonylcarbamoyladenosine biosynthesis protein TsaB
VLEKKPYILAIETSSRAGSAAIGLGSELLGSIDFTAGARHGVEILPSVDRLMKKLDLKPSQIEIICVSAGPGSFTGLRVGFTFARSLAQLTGAKLVAVPSTRVIVENLLPLLAKETGPIYIAPILDAKRKQVYTAGFLWEKGQFRQVLEESVLPPAELLNRLGRPLWVTGEGLDYHREGFEGQTDVIFTDRTLWPCRAECVLKLGTDLAREERFTPCNELVPTYVRLPEAEENWQLRHAENGK